ncbi:methyltransferase-like protein 21D-like [Planoprotostelium fungivorum]|uniref:Methyltransferase-like protein 21D-like n=1 Tax=Planoprotostelium fungivorum TaxID=1890364 RepID=A0A2P6NGV7_9EUKA|nr:methyltransferase-like protein 21D-like [Planoprotostelium fungivorum]
MTESTSSLDKRIEYNSQEIIIKQDFSGELGATVWDASIVLIKYIQNQNLQGKRILELGAGTGAVSIAAAFSGAEVTATDRTNLLPLIQQNIDLNHVSQRVKARVLEWGDTSALESLSPPFDLVLASDVIANCYSHDLEGLMSTIHSASTTNTRIILSHELRSKEDLVAFRKIKDKFTLRKVGLGFLSYLRNLIGTSQNRPNMFLGMLLCGLQSLELCPFTRNFGLMSWLKIVRVTYQPLSIENPQIGTQHEPSFRLAGVWKNARTPPRETGHVGNAVFTLNQHNPAKTNSRTEKIEDMSSCLTLPIRVEKFRRSSCGERTPIFISDMMSVECQSANQDDKRESKRITALAALGRHKRKIAGLYAATPNILPRSDVGFKFTPLERIAEDVKEEGKVKLRMIDD